MNKRDMDTETVKSITQSLKQMLGLPEDITLEELHERNQREYPLFLARMEERKLQRAKDEILAMEIANGRKEEERREKLC